MITNVIKFSADRKKTDSGFSGDQLNAYTCICHTEANGAGHGPVITGTRFRLEFVFENLLFTGECSRARKPADPVQLSFFGCPD